MPKGVDLPSGARWPLCKRGMLNGDYSMPAAPQPPAPPPPPAARASTYDALKQAASNPATAVFAISRGLAPSRPRSRRLPTTKTRHASHTRRCAPRASATASRFKRAVNRNSSRRPGSKKAYRGASSAGSLDRESDHEQGHALRRASPRPCRWSSRAEGATAARPASAVGAADVRRARGFESNGHTPEKSRRFSASTSIASASRSSSTVIRARKRGGRWRSDRSAKRGKRSSRAAQGYLGLVEMPLGSTTTRGIIRSVARSVPRRGRAIRGAPLPRRGAYRKGSRRRCARAGPTAGKRFPSTIAPVAGDLFWYPVGPRQRNGHQPAHVGIVGGADDREVITFEGNCQNAYRITRRPRAGLISRAPSKT